MKIDRKQLVSRHTIHSDDPTKVIPVGNGEFCFSCDITGLQTFRGNIMSHWGWHSDPLPAGISFSDIPTTGSYMSGRLTGTGEDLIPPDKQTTANYLFQNPHSFNLGRFQLLKRNGKDPQVVQPQEISQVERQCDLWNGVVTSSFLLDGIPVHVTICVHSLEDTVAIQIHSPWVKAGTLCISLDFPYPSLHQDPWVGDFTKDTAHTTEFIKDPAKNRCQIRRHVDSTEYSCQLFWTNCVGQPQGAHRYLLVPAEGETIQLVCKFSSESTLCNSPLESFDAILEKTSAHWNRFWSSGGAIDLSGSKDSRWFELERRIVLSQYLLAVQGAGSLPCAEAGLMNMDGWSGQFHMEMTWWHIAHYALWNRMDMADRQLECYPKFLPVAKKLAAQLGYRGAKWGKMVGPEGRTAPWKGNLALLWKQPHPIFFAELEYLSRPTMQTLKKWESILYETAEHMADYAVKQSDGLYHLDPVMPPSELGFTHDSVFDLAYWKWGLDTAQTWRERMGLPRIPKWDQVSENLAPLPEQDGVYIRSPQWLETYKTQTYEHPDMVGIYGMLPPTKMVEPQKARATLRKVWETWDKNRIWGWDFPWIAMCAVRTGEPEIAVEAMLSDQIDVIGTSNKGSSPYLPANGGILFAAAMMAVGKDGQTAPGFPKDGNWDVKWEQLLGW